MSADLDRHAGFLRRLARDLVRDTHAADDVVHDAYLAALSRGGRLSRAYLAATVRHKAYNLLRGRRHRAARERIAAQPEARPPTSDLAAEAEIHRLVAAAVAALDAPYRDAILLRYHHGLEPREIAARLGAPVGTVKTRLRRGLEMLRARLDAAHGGETRAWALGLVAFVGAARPLAKPLFAGRVAVAALLVAGAATVAIGPKNGAAPIERFEAQSQPLDEPAATAAPDAPPTAVQDDAAAPALPPVMRWQIEENACRPPSGATIILRLDHEASRPPLRAEEGAHPFDISKARARVEGNELVAEGDLEPAGGNVIAVTPDGALGYVRWNRDANHFAPVVFGRPRTVRVRVSERNGGTLAGVPLLLKEGYTPDARGRTDPSGELTFEGRFNRFGKVIDAFVEPDATLGTGWLWIGTVDPRRGDGRIEATIEPLEPFAVRVLVRGAARWPTAEDGVRPDKGDVLEGIDVEHGTAVGVTVDEGAATVRFHARRWRAGAPLRVKVRFRGAEPVDLEIREHDADCELARGGTLAGTVLPPRDKEYRLRLDQRRRDRWIGMSHISARPKDGVWRWQASDVAPGEYWLCDELSGIVLGPFELAAGQLLELPPLDLASCAWVAGRVEPAPSTSCGLAHTGPGITPLWPVPVDNGRFRLRVPGDRETTLVLDCPTLVADPVRVAGGGEIVIHAREGSSVTMRLLRPPRGEDEPQEMHVRGAWLSRAGKPGVWRDLTVDRDTGAEGFGGLEPGRYDDVLMFVGPYPWVRLRDLDIAPGLNDLGEISVPRGSRVLARIRVPEGQGPPRLCLGARPLDHSVKVAPYTNPEARDVVALGGLGEGRWRLSAYVMRAPEISFEREIVADGRTDVEWELDLRR